MLTNPLRTLLTAVLCTAGSAVATPAHWVRSPVISPDGQRIAFVLRGQIRLVGVGGGVAVPLSPAEAYSAAPVWSPDSQQLAFASDLQGDDDVYVAQLGTGVMTRRTFSSAPEVPTGWSPDGKNVVFTSPRLGDPQASRFTALLGQSQVYATPATSGGKTLLIPTFAQQASWNPAGTKLVYAYNSSLDPAARQKRVAANAGEIWLYDPKTRQHQALVRDGKDARTPVWAPDGQAVYYLSERSGRLNIWKRELASGHDTQLTEFANQPVRGLSVSKGGVLAFVQAGQLYTLRPGGRPQMVRVDLAEVRPDSHRTYVDTASAEFQVSPDGKLFALTSRGNVFLMDKQGQTYQVTDTPEEERNVSFSPDGGFLTYSSARRGADGQLQWRLYKNHLPHKGDYTLGTYQESVINTGAGAAQQPVWSPDGQKIAFVYERREVRVLDTKNGKITTLYQPSDYHTSYHDGDLQFHWSPDSRHLLVPWRTVPFSVVARWGIVPADGSAPLRPISERLAEVDDTRWSPDGTQILALTRRDAPRTLDQNALGDNLYRIFMSDEARRDFLANAEDAQAPHDDSDEKDNAEEDAAEDNKAWPQRQNKHVPPTSQPAPAKEQAPDEEGWPPYTFQQERSSRLEGVLTRQQVEWVEVLPDGLSAVMAHLEGDTLVWEELNLQTGEVQPWGEAQGPFGSDTQLQLGQKGDVLYALSDGQVSVIPLDNPQQTKHIPFELRQRQLASQVRQATFDAFWLDLKQTFYRADMHGLDWANVYATYQPYLADIATTRELAQLFDEISGGLSASHLFPGAERLRVVSDGSSDTQTASLGIFTNNSYSGPGVQIAALLPGGPLDAATEHILPGDIVVSVGGKALDATHDLDLLLDGKADKRVPVMLRRGNKEWLETVRPISLEREQALNAQRVIDLRRQLVNTKSQGKLAYSYLPEMNNDAYIQTYNDLVTMQDQRTGAILDVRSNLGGDLNRQLMNFLGRKPFAQYGREGQPWATDPTDSWVKKSALLVDSFAYSDGSVFPQSYQDAGLGPVVGSMMLNTGTGINEIQSALLPELWYSIPIMPMRRLDGSYYENNLIRPNIPIPHDPNAEQAGRDVALEAAIAALMK